MANKRIKKYRVGIESETYAISMVEAPAIESDFVALSKEDEMKVFLEKDERHMVYGAALIPDKDIYRNNGEQEFYISFTKESIEKMAQDFMKNYRQNEVTLDHDEQAKDITVVESWLVEDSYKDKANALGINAPQGTWMVGMKVNQIDVWERVKSGELKGFSVESLIQLEEFEKNDKNNMEDEMMFQRISKAIKDAFKEMALAFSLQDKKAKDEVQEIEELAAMSGMTSEEYKQEVDAIKAELEEQPTVEPTAVEQPTEEPTVEEQPTEEPTVVEEPKVDVSHLEELVKSLKSEIEALKEVNSGLQDKVKTLEREPSSKPINVNAKNNGGDGSNYSAWREQMRNMIG